MRSLMDGGWEDGGGRREEEDGAKIWKQGDPTEEKMGDQTTLILTYIDLTDLQPTSYLLYLSLSPPTYLLPTYWVRTTI